MKKALFAALIGSSLGFSCNNAETSTVTEQANGKDSVRVEKKREPVSEPLVSDIYTADPSAHVFKGRIYIYPSHDSATGTAQNANGDHFDMMDYHILSLDTIGGNVIDHGAGFSIKNIPWAGRQLWAPDAAFANKTYYLYFPAKHIYGM